MMRHYYLKWHKFSKILASLLFFCVLIGSVLVVLTDWLRSSAVYLLLFLLPLALLLLRVLCRRWVLCVMTHGLAWRDELLESWQQRPGVGYVDWCNVTAIERCSRRLSSKRNTLIRFRRDALLPMPAQQGQCHAQASLCETDSVVLATHLLAGDEDAIFAHLCRCWQAAAKEALIN